MKITAFLSPLSLGTILRSALVLMVGLITAQSQDVFTNSLKAYYPFTGNGNDASGNGYNLSLTGQAFIADGLCCFGKHAGAEKTCRRALSAASGRPVGPIAISRRLPQVVSRGDSACS